MSVIWTAIQNFAANEYPPAGAPDPAPCISGKTWGSVAIVVGCVALGALVGVALAFAVALTWPIWLTITVGVAIGLGIGLAAGAVFHSQCTQERIHSLVEDTQELRDERAGWNTVEQVIAGMPTNDHWRIIERGHREDRVIVAEGLEREPHHCGRGMAKKVKWINDAFVWMRPLPGREEVFERELQEVRDIRQQVMNANPELGHEPTDEQMCLQLDVRRVEIPGHSARAVAKRYLGDLRDVFNGTERVGEVTEADILSVIADMQTGLRYLHSAGFTHGDISPQNVFIYRNEAGLLRAVIADFGQTRSIEEGDAVLHGDWSYSSPEQRRHQPSDVYGIGLLGIRLLDHLAGRRAVNGNTVEEQFPVPRGRDFSALKKTAHARVAGIFGSIAYRPQAQIHAHIDELVDAPADLRNRLKEMTLDNPLERRVMNVAG